MKYRVAAICFLLFAVAVKPKTVNIQVFSPNYGAMLTLTRADTADTFAFSNGLFLYVSNWRFLPGFPQATGVCYNPPFLCLSTPATGSFRSGTRSAPDEMLIGGENSADTAISAFGFTSDADKGIASASSVPDTLFDSSSLAHVSSPFRHAKFFAMPIYLQAGPCSTACSALTARSPCAGFIVYEATANACMKLQVQYPVFGHYEYPGVQAGSTCTGDTLDSVAIIWIMGENGRFAIPVNEVRQSSVPCSPAAHLHIDQSPHNSSVRFDIPIATCIRILDARGRAVASLTTTSGTVAVWNAGAAMPGVYVAMVTTSASWFSRSFVFER